MISEYAKWADNAAEAEAAASTGEPDENKPAATVKKTIDESKLNGDLRALKEHADATDKLSELQTQLRAAEASVPRVARFLQQCSATNMLNLLQDDHTFEGAMADKNYKVSFAHDGR